MTVDQDYRKALGRLADSVALPMACVQGWLSFSTAWMRAWTRVAETQFQFLARQEAAFRRTTARRPLGAAWTEQYGRRSRDIDVEKV